MKLVDFLAERIDTSGLYQTAFEACRSALRKWTVTTFAEVQKEAKWSIYANEISKIYDLVKMSNEDERRLDELREKQTEHFRSVLYGAQRQKGHYGSLYTNIMDELKDILERTLQNTTKEYLESKLGQIEPYNHDEDDMFSKKYNKNLYWLQHIVVRLDFNATNKHSGDQKIDGGYYQQHPRTTELDTQYATQNVDRMKDLVELINLHWNKDSMWYLGKFLLLQEMEEEVYGEATSFDPTTTLDRLKSILTTYVHEVVHMEQWAREKQRRNANGDGKVSHGITYLPDPAKKRKAATNWYGTKTDAKGSPVRNKDVSPDQPWKRVIKGGLRGRPTADLDKATPDQFIAYLGTAHEIEAFAAGCASEIFAGFYHDLRKNGRSAPNVETVNYYVDTAISDLTHGWAESSSLKRYEDWIANKLSQVDFSNPASRTKAIRKVWVTFMRKVVKHLQGFKKEIPKDEW